MRIKMKIILVILTILPSATFADNVPIKESLAKLIENAVLETNLSINVVSQTESSVNINKINGVNVCMPEIKSQVLMLQKALFSNVNARRVYSMYEIDIRLSPKGKILHLNNSSSEFRKIIKGCINVYVAIE